MEARLRARIDELRRELEVGEARVNQLDQERAQVRDAVLRISGAIQVLEELLREPSLATTPTDASSRMPEAPTDAGR